MQGHALAQTQRQPTAPRAVAPAHTTVERCPFLLPSSPIASRAGSDGTEQANSIPGLQLLRSPVSPLPPTCSASLLPPASPRSLIMQNATAPACPGNYRVARLQLLSLVLKVPPSGRPASRPALSLLAGEHMLLIQLAGPEPSPGSLERKLTNSV
jgi:hypothetical protein